MNTKVKYSILDLVPLAENTTLKEAFDHSVEIAQLAESLGYTRLWFAEHHNMDGIASSATSVLIGHIAGKTNSIRVGSGGVMLPNHSALVIAEQFGTLEALYPNRIDLGIGRAPGSDQATMRALRREHSGISFPEQVNELFSYFSTSENARVIANPGRGQNIPIWILGSSLYGAELAGRLGLPFSFASHFAPDLMMEALHVYREFFTPSQFLKTPYAMIGAQVVGADTDEEAEFLSTTGYQRFLALLRGQSIKMKPPVKDMSSLWSPAEEEYVKNKLSTSVRGSKETMKKQLKYMLDFTGVQEVIFVSDLYHHEHRLRSFKMAAEIMKELHS